LSIELYAVEAASALRAASFIKVDIAVGFIYMKVECVELAEIVYRYSIKFADLAAVSGKIMAFWDITSCDACKYVPAFRKNLAIQPSVFFFLFLCVLVRTSVSCSPWYMPSHLYVCYLPIWLTVLP